MGKKELISCDFCEKEIKDGEKHFAVHQDIMCSDCYAKLEKNKGLWFQKKKQAGGDLYAGQGLTQ